tara:strand:- start:3167 stop:3964 length:798 start_codon:yes stop_codon:yes gene_type:complete
MFKKKLSRLYISLKQKLCNKSFLLLNSGINIGAGNQCYIGWIGIDQLNGSFLNETSILNYKNSSINAVYSSHFFEHVNNKTFENIIREIYRVLKPGGIFRIVIPDFEKIHDSLVNQNTDFFKKTGFMGRDEWEAFGIEKNIYNIALHWFANYQNQSFEGSQKESYVEELFRGPPKIDSNIVKKKAQTLDTLSFGKWAISKVPKKFIKNGGHINVYTRKRLLDHLKSVGFNIVDFDDLANSEIMAVKYFDRNPNRSSLSLYCTAIK